MKSSEFSNDALTLNDMVVLWLVGSDKTYVLRDSEKNCYICIGAGSVRVLIFFYTGLEARYTKLVHLGKGGVLQPSLHPLQHGTPRRMSYSWFWPNLWDRA